MIPKEIQWVCSFEEFPQCPQSAIIASSFAKKNSLCLNIPSHYFCVWILSPSYQQLATRCAYRAVHLIPFVFFSVGCLIKVGDGLLSEMAEVSSSHVLGFPNHGKKIARQSYILLPDRNYVMFFFSRTFPQLVSNIHTIPTYAQTFAIDL